MIKTRKDLLLKIDWENSLEIAKLESDQRQIPNISDRGHIDIEKDLQLIRSLITRPDEVILDSFKNGRDGGREGQSWFMRSFGSKNIKITKRKALFKP